MSLIRRLNQAQLAALRGRLPDGRDLLILVGLGLLTYGVALVSRPAAFVVCGVVLLLLGLAGTYEIVRAARR